MSTENSQTTQRIKEPEAARYIGMSPMYLRFSRMGKCPGPPFIRINHAIVYDTRDLDRWLESRKHSCSTAG